MKDEDSGSLPHVAAALAATAAGNAGPGRSVPTVVARTVGFPFPLWFLPPEGGSGFLLSLTFVIDSL